MQYPYVNNGANYATQQIPTMYTYAANNPNNNFTPAQQQIQRSSTFRNRLIQSLIDLVVICIIFAAFGITYAKLAPRIRYFHCVETDIFFPYKDDSVPFWAVGLYGTIAPFIIILIVEAINANVCRRHEGSLRMFGINILHAMSLFVLGISITLLLTEIGKRWIGRLRPHFIAVCNPDLAAITCQAANGIYNTIDTSGSFCKGTAKDVEEARLSFPSGHSSYSTYTMLFVILYLQARLVLYKLRFLKPLIQMTAFIAAYITSISRIGDYYHRGSDVIGGIVLGGIIAVFVTVVLGRVLWYFGVRKDYLDFDLKPVRNR